MPVNDDLSPIRGFLIPLGNARMLLPNSTVAEVVDYLPPRPLPGAPSWLLGMANWRGQQIPLYSHEHAMGQRPGAPDRRSRVLVINALGGVRTVPHYGVLARGIPNLVMVDRGNIEAREQMLKSPVIRAYAILNGNEVIIPDLDRIETMLAGFLASLAGTQTA